MTGLSKTIFLIDLIFTKLPFKVVNLSPIFNSDSGIYFQSTREGCSEVTFNVPSAD